MSLLNLTRELSNEMQAIKRGDSNSRMSVFAYFARNPSEEIFLKGLIDAPAPAFEDSTYTDLKQQKPPSLVHIASEELFSTWISNSSCDQGQGHGALAGCRRMSSDLVAAFLAQHADDTHDTLGSTHQQLEQHAKSSQTPLDNVQTKPPRNSNSGGIDPGAQKLSWFQQNYPMTRSRSSELRRRYQEAQKLPTKGEMPVNSDMQNISLADQISGSPFLDYNISSVVGLLKGSLERKKRPQQKNDNLFEDAKIAISPCESSASEQNGEGSVLNNGHEVQQQTKKYRPRLLSQPTDDADCTKRRRVERKRMMVEAKCKGHQLPATSLEMQAALKRCENLEKEVRSLKLNLAFMNRKDSEQTKRIEELEQQNDGLLRQKQELLEELRKLS